MLISYNYHALFHTVCPMETSKFHGVGPIYPYEYRHEKLMKSSWEFHGEKSSSVTLLYMQCLESQLTLLAELYHCQYCGILFLPLHEFKSTVSPPQLMLILFGCWTYPCSGSISVHPLPTISDWQWSIWVCSSGRMPLHHMVLVLSMRYVYRG